MQTAPRLYVLLAILACTTSAAAQNRSEFEPPRARTTTGQPGASLTPPSTAASAAILAQYLRGQGRDEATVRSIVEASRSVARDGITHARFEQRASGVAVHGTYAKAAFNGRGEMVHLIENLVSVPPSIARARITAQQAVTQAVAHLYPGQQNATGGFFRSPPAANRVAIPHEDGSMSFGFLS